MRVVLSGQGNKYVREGPHMYRRANVFVDVGACVHIVVRGQETFLSAAWGQEKDKSWLVCHQRPRGMCGVYIHCEWEGVTVGGVRAERVNTWI